MALRTSLHDWHVRHGGRIVEFGGWDMPVQYAGIVEEHNAVRTAAGVFDVSHMGRLAFDGPDALDLIQYVYTNNAATMKEGQVRYGLICNERAGIRDDVLVYRWPGSWSMVVNASNRAKIVEWIQVHKGTRNVHMVDRTLETCMIAVQGPQALSIAAGIVSGDPSKLAYYHAMPSTYRGEACVVSRTGYTGEDGLEVIAEAHRAVALWEELVSRGAKPCGLGARDTLRLEAAMPLYGHELTEDIDPLQAGLSWAVKLDKGDFVGRDALLKRKETPRRVRIGLELAGKRIARDGAEVLDMANRVAGVVSSGTFGPTVQKAIAMAYVDPGVGPDVQIDIRGKCEPARVVPLPFYKRK